MCLEKQILPKIFYYLKTATIKMTVPFMYNFRNVSDKFPKIFWSLIFHILLPSLGYKKGNLEFSDSKMSDR